ncbi:MAG TPA: DUF4394 domain-containing protein [Thermoanaerobaculia bacterium]|nr:DUF4394 domain-containing protein [Thermoanaerobaculia bacterium]
MRRVWIVALGLFAAVSLFAEPITLLETGSAGSALRFIDSSNPSVSLGFVTITGLQPGEIIAGIDYRPSNGLLYGIGAIDPATGRLYQVNTTTGVATQIGAPFSLNAIRVNGMDFNPVVDLLRVITNTSQNVRINPNTGAVTPDTFVSYAPGDPNAGSGNTPWGLGYSNNFAGATQTTLYGITYGFNQMILVTVGSVNGTPVSPNSGLMFTVGGTGVNNASNDFTGLDVSSTGIAYALMNSPVRLYTINLTNGALTLVGNFPATTFGSYRDLAVGGAVLSAGTPTAPALSPAMLVLLALALGAAALFVMKR